jgi:hypothetical protein
MQAASSAPDLPRLSRRQSYGPTSSSLYLDSLPPFSGQKSLAKGQRSVPAIEHLSHPNFPPEEARTPGGSLIVRGKVVDVGGLGVEPWNIWSGSGQTVKEAERDEVGPEVWDEQQRQTRPSHWSPQAYANSGNSSGEATRTPSAEPNNVGHHILTRLMWEVG